MKTIAHKIVRLYTDEAYCAECASLRYIKSSLPGYTRKKWGRGFRYLTPEKKVLKNSEIKEWIESLAIPPSWEQTWISPHNDAHLLATGYDEAERKQYLYHTKWREFRDTVNSHRLIPFGLSLPAIRKYTKSQLQKTELDRNVVIAAVIELIDKTAIRIGNQTYANTNHSYGATTLPAENIEIHDGKIHLQFTGKGGKDQDILFQDKPLARVLEQLEDQEGDRLFSYSHDSHHEAITSSDVNDQLQFLSGFRISAKDFRTWHGTLEAFKNALNQEEEKDHTKLTEVYKQASQKLGNTPGMTRDHYIHKGILELIKEERLHDFTANISQKKLPELNRKESFLLHTITKLAKNHDLFQYEKI